MLDIFEDEIKESLNKEGMTANKYFGELSNPSLVKIDINKLPLIYIDYVGNKPINPVKKEHNFCLYIAHISFSKNPTTRTSKHYELYDVLEKLNQTLNLKSFNQSEPIKMGKTQKIYDQATEKGYLTVFKQDFSAILK